MKKLLLILFFIPVSLASQTITIGEGVSGVELGRQFNSQTPDGIDVFIRDNVVASIIIESSDYEFDNGFRVGKSVRYFENNFEDAQLVVKFRMGLERVYKYSLGRHSISLTTGFFGIVKKITLS